MENKNNIFKNGVMSQMANRSATLVMSSDPRLKMNEVAISPEVAEKLGLHGEIKKTDKNGKEYIIPASVVLLGRDPMLKSSGLCAKKVVIRDDIHGCAIHPIECLRFQGDFDGDALALFVLSTKEARNEAKQKFSAGGQLLDYGSERDEEGRHKLLIDDGLDTKLHQYLNPKSKENYEAIVTRANDREKELLNGKPIVNKALAQRETIVELDNYFKEVFDDSFGNMFVDFTDKKSVMESLELAVKSGAKGSYGKLRNCANYFGVDYEDKEDGSINWDSFVDISDKSKATRQDDLDVQFATAIKTMGTGLAGKVAQDVVKATRNGPLRQGLEMTFLVTQGTLQVKHEAEKGRKILDLSMNGLKRLWDGRAVTPSLIPDGTLRYIPDYKKDLSPALMKEQFYNLYTSKDGLDVSIDKAIISDVVDHLSEHAEDRMSIHKVRATLLDDLSYDRRDVVNRLMMACERGEGIYDNKSGKDFMNAKTRKLYNDLNNVKKGDLLKEEEILKNSESIMKHSVDNSYVSNKGRYNLNRIRKEEQYVNNLNQNVLDDDIIEEINEGIDF